MQFLAPLGNGLVRWLILPIYRTIVAIKIKFHRLVAPTRGFALFFVSNRYLFHGVLGIAVLTTLTLNLGAGQVLAQDVGHDSLLYALATDSEIEIVQETARADEGAQTSSYLEQGTLIAIPHIDFDYSDDSQEIASTAIPGSISAVPYLDIETRSGAPRTETETYVVTAGDTIASIAHNFNVNVGTVLWANQLGERQYIRPGDNLKIPPVSGVLVTIKSGDTIAKLANKYSGKEKEILAFNKISDETALGLGAEIMIPGGTPPAVAPSGSAVASARTPSYNPNVVKPADVDASHLASSKLLWPTSGHVITQYYGWRHTGLDIDGTLSSPLYAAADGVVEVSGWNSGGYGYQILISHPNGIKTRYAHASKLYVKAGQQVKRGQVIAMMGSTGRSTGSHLHFEVYVSGRRVNPLSYIR